MRRLASIILQIFIYAINLLYATNLQSPLWFPPQHRYPPLPAWALTTLCAYLFTLFRLIPHASLPAILEWMFSSSSVDPDLLPWATAVPSTCSVSGNGIRTKLFRKEKEYQQVLACNVFIILQFFNSWVSLCVFCIFKYIGEFCCWFLI